MLARLAAGAFGLRIARVSVLGINDIASTI
jgi:hypothetical protein